MKRFLKYVTLILIAAIIPIGTKIGVSYGKYAYNSVWNYYLKSKGFYFDSNILNQNNTKIVNNLWDGGHVYFDLRNNLNDSISSDVDINYKITCSIIDSSTDASCNILDTNKDTYEGVLSSFKSCKNIKNDGVDVKKYDKATCEMNGYLWENQIALKDIYFDIVGNETEVESAKIRITAESTSPYKKTLSNEFILTRDKNTTGTIDYDYIDEGPEGRFIISNSYEENKCVRLNWNSSNLKIDLEKNKVTKYATDSNGYINEIDIKLENQSSTIFKFYDNNINEYNKSEFTLTEINC